MRRLRRVSVFLRAELEAASSFVPLIVVSLLIVVGLSRGDVTLASPVFQSPVGTPTTAPPGAPTVAPTEAVPPGVTPEPPMGVTPEGPAEPTPEGPAEPEETPTEGEPPEEPPPGDEEEPSPPASSSGATFIDTCVLGFSYLWLCLGGLVLVLFVLGVVFSFLLRRA
jgi:uncharacterized membrane protein